MKLAGGLYLNTQLYWGVHLRLYTNCLTCCKKLFFVLAEVTLCIHCEYLSMYVSSHHQNESTVVLAYEHMGTQARNPMSLYDFEAYPRLLHQGHALVYGIC